MQDISKFSVTCSIDEEEINLLKYVNFCSISLELMKKWARPSISHYCNYLGWRGFCVSQSIIICNLESNSATVWKNYNFSTASVPLWKKMFQNKKYHLKRKKRFRYRKCHKFNKIKTATARQLFIVLLARSMEERP